MFFFFMKMFLNEFFDLIDMLNQIDLDLELEEENNKKKKKNQNKGLGL